MTQDSAEKEDIRIAAENFIAFSRIPGKFCRLTESSRPSLVFEERQEMRTKNRSVVHAATRGVVLGTAFVGMVNWAHGQVSTTWVGAGTDLSSNPDSTWTNSANWNPSIPTIVDTAVFNAAPTNGLTTVSLGATTQVISGITFSATPTTFTLGSDSADVLAFTNAIPPGGTTSSSIIQVTSGAITQNINAGMNIASGTLTIMNTSLATTSLNLNGVISGSGNVMTAFGGIANSIAFNGNNTYSGITDLNSNKTIIQIGSSSVVNGDGSLASGPFGVGTLEPDNPTNSPLMPVGAARTIANPVFLASGTTISAASTPQNLTFAGPVTFSATGRTMNIQNYGATVFLGSASAPNFITLGTPTASTTAQFAVGTSGTGTTPGTAATLVINDVIQDPTPLPVTPMLVDFGGGIANFAGNILINGANTYKGDTTVHPISGANGGGAVQQLVVGIGVNSVVDASNNIVSGPFGRGTVKTVSGDSSGFGPSILEPVGADRIIANNVTIANASSAGWFFNNPSTFGDSGFHNIIFSGNFATGNRTYTNNLDLSVAVYFGSGTALTSTFSGGGTWQTGSGHAGNYIIDDKVTGSIALGIQNLAVITLRNDANNQTGNWTVQSTGTLKIGASHALGSSNVIVNGLLQALPGLTSAVVLPPTVPTINSTGKFDLTNDSMVYNYTATDQAANLRVYLKNGYAGGAWNGAFGINSSTAAADATKATALGYGEATDLGFSGNSNFKNTAIAGNADVVRYTYYGDSSLDGKVDLGNDFNLFLQGFLNSALLTPANSWELGDYNYDGVVDVTNDFNLFINGFTASQTGGSLGDLANVIESSSLLSTAQKASLLSVVPEPASLGLLSMAAVGLVARRRRA
jgi:hypothetical protein